MEEFNPDCENCAALCCFALAFDRGDMFGHDKDAGVPCHRLDGNACSIHDKLADRGYHGCVAFDCLGAGQRTTALFDPTWREDRSVTRAMIAAFSGMRALQEARLMLALAMRGGPVALTDDQKHEAAQWDQRLQSIAEDVDAVSRYDSKPLHEWLQSLAPMVTR
ncbi:hypothetical protein [Celeribacter arenosi]|uniref:Pentapeptide repeat-containing protein n=1 Tax=Celeribacter arenosi TaxID=792649 RepID=A0ABP7K9I5_9RHOB